jgi:arsenite oxidase large subunit
VSNLRGASVGKKNEQLAGEPHEPGRIIIVDPRRTVTVAACEAEAGKDRVLHLQLNSGTDLALFNAIFTEIAAKSWVDQDFIEASTLREGTERPPLYPARGTGDDKPGHLTSFEDALEGCRTSLEEAEAITGVPAADIAKAAAWIAEPKQGGARRRTMIGYEKGIIWGNDNYRTNGAIVNIALATGNIGRPGGGVVRLGGHQEGYVRPGDGHVGRPAAYVDRLIIEGKGGVHHIWACDHYKTTLNALEFKRRYKERTDLVKDAMSGVPYGDRAAMVEAIMVAIRAGGLFSVDVDIVPTKIGQASHVWLPAATSGEMNLTSMNGERRMRLTERYMDPPGQSVPDCLIAARIANHLERIFREQGKEPYADQFKGFDWQTEEDAFTDGYHANASGGEFVTYERLKAMGTNGFQEPATAFEDGKIVGTQRLYTEGVFSSDDGKARFMDAPWRGLQAEGKQAEKDKFAFLINNGRTNHVWQNAYLDQENELVMDRWPYPFIEMNPADMTELGLNEGDLVEIYNDNGSTQAAVYPTPTAKPKETFMLFAYPTGVQGNVVSAGVNELIIPNYKQTWGNIRKIADAPEGIRHQTFKSQEYSLG